MAAALPLAASVGAALGLSRALLTTMNTPESSGAARTALRNMGWILGDKVLAMALGLLIFGMIARALGPVGSGHFAYAAALLQVGLGLSLVCSAQALLPRFCRMQAALPGAIANVFAVRMCASLLSMVVMWGYCLLTITEPQRLLVTMIFLLAVPLIEPFYVIATYWSSRNHNRPNIVARSTGLVCRALIVAIGINVGAPVWLLAAAWVIEAAVNAAIQSAQLRHAMPGRRMRRFVHWRRAKLYLRFGARYLLSLWLQVLFMRLDRLLLGSRMEPEPFGIYATAMQLMDVWVQVAYLIGLSLATAYLYRRIGEGRFGRAFVGTAAAMTAFGLAGLLGAWLLGPLMLRVVFGPQFAGSYPYLVAGSAFAVLVFANQILQLTLTTLDRPFLLVGMWVVAVAVAAPIIWIGFDTMGAMAGPFGLGIGLLASWLSLLPLKPMRPARERLARSSS